MAVTNLFIPVVFNVSRFGRYGPAFSLVFLAVTAHAIIRHRLMNIKLVISRSVAYVLAATLSGAVFAVLAWLISRVLISRQWEIPLWLGVGLVFPIALLVHPIKHLFQTSVDRYLFRESYNYQRIIREASRTMGTMLDLPSLHNYICDVIRRTLRPESVALYTRSSDVDSYTLIALQPLTNPVSVAPPKLVPDSSPLVRFLRSAKSNTLIRAELERDGATPYNLALADALFMLDAECVHPIARDHELSGFLVLGPKLSGDPYFSEDLDLIATLIGQASMAVKNAELYRQVVLVNEYVDNILTNIESGVIAISPDEVITMFNAAAERMTGLKVFHTKGAPASILPIALSAPLHDTLADGYPRLQFETRVQSPTGESTPVICSTSMLRDRAGTVLGVTIVFSDLSRLKKLEGEKQRAERLASIGALASGIAHEIKNPLVAIRTFAELLPERFTEEDFRGEFAKVVIDEIERIDDLVARLRSLAAPPTTHLAPLDVRESIQETLSLLRAQLEQKRIHVITTFPDSLPPVPGDRAQLKQLFLNLLMNSVEAMDSGGDLSIRVATSIVRGSQLVSVEVEDTGSGIPDTLIENIFDPFITTKPRGSGLGLFICRGITDIHRATIRARNNTTGVGATVSIEFPVTEPAETALRP